ncbi:Amb a 1-like protein [Artemisia annua]|uniref:Pectate lyase n=1 Tax=Artemisia annua TaxID=35608 RepID=A0A2U1NBC2_ARTAN|nr:Amb a 1-like protein [Artemisia annua]
MEIFYFVVILTLAFVIVGEAVRTDINNEFELCKQFLSMLRNLYRAQLNSTRRDLHECQANNIIDKCWRCKPNWCENRQALANCAQGFAKGTTGGKGGEIYKVTNPSDDDAANPKEGTLRCGVTKNKPLWIIFEKDMVINLKHELVIQCDKTIDGRGAKVEITGAGLTLMNVKNVIIHGIHIHDIVAKGGGMIKNSDGPPGLRQKSDGDGICVTGSSKVWIDHCTLSNAFDGLIDVTLKSSFITISNCKFTHHQKVILFGADDSHTQDQDMLATVAFNLFTDGCDQRMPRCRHGFFQVVNNNYCGWGTYAIGGSAKPTILSCGNLFKAPNDPAKKKVLVRADAPESESMKWNWRTHKDKLENGAIFIPSGCDPQLTPAQKAGLIEAEPGENVPKLTSCAGVLSCKPGQPC